MNDSLPTLNPDGSPKTGRVRRIALLSVAGLLVLVVAFVLLLPTFIGWGLFHDRVVNGIAAIVNGKVTIESIEAGWTSGMAVRGLKIDDDANGNRIEATVAVDQGLWHVVTGGLFDMTVHVQGKVRTRRLPDGTLSLSKLVRPAIAQASANATRNGAVQVQISNVVPEGTNLRLLLEGLTFEVDEGPETIYAAVRDVTGSVQVVAGGTTSAKIAGKTHYQGAAGEFSLDASSDGILNRGGELVYAGTPFTLKVTAKNVAMDAGGLAVHIADANVDVSSKDLTGPIDATVALQAGLDGAAPAVVDVKLAVAKLLDAKGGFVFDLAGVAGTVRATGVPTRSLQQFVDGTKVVLTRDVGDRVDLNASFANANGGGILLDLRSDRVQLHAEGSVDPATHAATLAKTTLVATIDPALAGAAGLVISAPSQVSVTATDVVVPASDATGAFPVNALRFSAQGSATLPGVRVSGPEGDVAIAVDAVTFSVSAAPLGDAINLDISATPSAAAAGGTALGPMKVLADLHKGGAFGWYGSVRAKDIPTALLDPWMPKGQAFKPSADLGTVISTLDATIAAGDAPAVLVALESKKVALHADGTVGADGATALKSAKVELRSVRPALLSQWGVNVDAPVALAAELHDVRIPAAKGFDVGALALDAGITVGRAAAVGQERAAGLRLTLGADPKSQRSFEIEPLRITVATRALGTDTSVTLATRVDGMPLAVNARAQGLYARSAGGASQLDLEGATFTAAADVTDIAAGRVAQEVPAIKEMITKVGDGRFALHATMDGKLLDGRVGVLLTSAAGAPAAQRAEVKAEAVLHKETVDAVLTAGLEVTPAMLAAAAPGNSMKLVAPARIDARVEGVTLKRTGPWSFEPPAQLQVTATVPALQASGIAGLQGDVALSAFEAQSAVTLAPRLAARGTLKTAVSAVPRGAAGAARAAPLDVGLVALGYGWTAAEGTAPATWDADLALTGIRGSGVEALVDVGDAARGQIGDGGQARVRASQSAAGVLAFDVDSQIPRLRAILKGDLNGEVLSLHDSSLNLSLPGPQVVALLNRQADGGGKAAQPTAAGEKPKQPAWKASTALDLSVEIPTFKMDVVPDRKPAVGEPAAALPENAEPPPAAAPSLKLPEGFAAVVHLSAKPVTLTPTEGAPVIIESLTLNADAPGLGKPAALKLDGALTDSAGKRAPIAVNATLRNWTRADGTVDFDAMQFDADARMAEASSAVLGTLAGMGTELTEALGPTATINAKVRSTGPGAAVADATVASKYLQFNAPQVDIKGGFVLVGAAHPTQLLFVPSDPIRNRLLESINPIFEDVRLADEKKPIVFQTTELRYPLDGDYAKCDGQFKLTVGDVLIDRNPQNDVLNMLKVFQTEQGKPVDGRIDPLLVAVRRGQLTYKDFNVYLEKQGANWVTHLIFSGDIDLTRKPPFARSIAANYPLSSVARSVVNMLPEESGGTLADVLGVMSFGTTDAVQLKVSMKGPLGDVNGKPAQLQRKVKVIFDPKAMGSGVGNAAKGIGSALEDLFGGNKKNNNNNKKKNPPPK